MPGEPTTLAHEAAPARTLVVSQRRLNPVLSNCLLFEFEDLVGEVEGAAMLAPAATPFRSALTRGMAERLAVTAPVLGSVAWRRLQNDWRRHELVFVDVLSLAGLAALQPVRGLARLGHTSICNITEVWARGLRERTGELRALRAFDVIAVGCAGSVDEVSRLTGRPCFYLPPSVDAMTMCPLPDGPDRVIDVYAMGRRPERTHAALLRMAAERRWYYMYDTVAGNVGFTSHREHRAQLGDRIQRSRYFLANCGKANAGDETGDQQEIGQRFFEGAAGGGVLFGAPPRTVHFQEWFGWEDAVIELPYDSEDVAGCLEALESDPARVERIRRRNVVESLRRHDHLHRWAQILQAARLPETPAMRVRANALEEKAVSVRGPAGSVAGAARAAPFG